MEMTVYGPKDPAAREELARRVADIQGEAVLSYLKNLPVSREEKRTLWRGAVSGGDGAE